MKNRRFAPRALSASMPSLADEVPEAPAGTIFVKAAQGGFAVHLRKFTLYLGRDTLNVHVPVGAGDQYISRVHGVFTCEGTQWRLRNEGRIPIRMLGEEPLLRGHEMPVPAGYTPLTIETPRPRSHWVEVHLVGSLSPDDDGADSQADTLRSDVYELSRPERLVIAALAQRYLRQERYPQPVSWKQVAEDVSRADPQSRWNVRSVEYIVAGVRKRLSRGKRPIAGLLREDGIGEPVGNTLNDRLIQALLKDATLLPDDLHLLGEGEVVE